MQRETGRRRLQPAMATKRIETAPELRRTARRLQDLLHAEPARALEEARRLAGRGKVQAAVRALRAAVLIDAGAATKNVGAVREGIAIGRRLFHADPDDSTI